MRLRWLWFQWKQRNRTWNGLDLPVDSRDKDIFAASTEVTIGDGNLTRFWQSSWVNGRTPKKNITLTLYKKAKRKNLSVRKALQDNPWISHITPLSTTQEIREYVMLWGAIGQTQLHEDREDNIR